MNPAVFIGCCNPPKVGADLIGADLIGCDLKVGCVVGAEDLSEAAGVWVKTHFFRQGPFLCATVYSVAAGEPRVIELRVDLRPITRALMRAHSAVHATELAKASIRGTTIGWGLGDLWKGVKKTAQKVGRSKLVKGVTGTVMSVARNKAFQVAMPMAALAAHTTSKGLGGKGAFKGALGKAVDLGTSATLSAVPGGAIAKGISAAPFLAKASPQALGAFAAANEALSKVNAARKVVQTAQSAASTLARGQTLARTVARVNQRTAAAVKTAGALMSPAQKAAVAARATAAGRIALNSRGKAAVAATLARVPATARAKVATTLAGKLKGLATLKSRVALAQSLPPTARGAVLAATKLQVQAAPAIRRAAATAKKLQSPAVRARLANIRSQGAKAEKLLSSVANRAKTGSLDAKKSAVIVNLVARNQARLQALSQANAGGIPGLLITKDGRLRRGRFRVEAVAKQNAVLYTGPGKPSARGQFQTVSGSIVLDSIAVMGELPIDGVRLQGKGSAAYGVGPYEDGAPLGHSVGCNDDSRCAPCAASS